MSKIQLTKKQGEAIMQALIDAKEISMHTHDGRKMGTFGRRDYQSRGFGRSERRFTMFKFSFAQRFKQFLLKKLL